MNKHDIDAETVTYYIHQAERMRAEALSELLFAWDAQLKQWMYSLGKLARSATQRGKWNTSLPAPHH
jgi:hypothetical protein